MVRQLIVSERNKTKTKTLGQWLTRRNRQMCDKNKSVNIDLSQESVTLLNNYLDSHVHTVYDGQSLLLAPEEVFSSL